jgi:DNA-binding response OmpR family regulator
MPIMDGFDFLEAFHDIKRQDKENTKIIVLTSSDDPKDKIKAKKMGAADYLTKPLHRESLLMAIQG